MVKAVIDINEEEDRILTIVKGKYGLKNKNESIQLIIQKFEEEILQANLRPEKTAKQNLNSKKVKKKNV